MGRDNNSRSNHRSGRSNSRSGRGGGRNNNRSSGPVSSETKATGGVTELKDNVFFINRPNQAHNFITVKKEIIEHLNKTLNDNGVMGDALEEGKHFAETKPMLWKLDSNGDKEKDAKGNFIEDKIDKTSLRGYECTLDLGDWRKRREAYDKNKVVACAIILGQCSKNVITKLEANVNCDTIRKDPIA